jgi:hypothetical protein
VAALPRRAAALERVTGGRQRSTSKDENCVLSSLSELIGARRRPLNRQPQPETLQGIGREADRGVTSPSQPPNLAHRQREPNHQPKGLVEWEVIRSGGIVRLVREKVCVRSRSSWWLTLARYSSVISRFVGHPQCPVNPCDQRHRRNLHERHDQEPISAWR